MTTLGSHLFAFTHSRDYGSVGKEFRTAGTTGVTMVQCEQPAGDYRRPAADEFGLSLVFAGSKLKVDHGVRWEAEPPPVNDLILGPRLIDLSYELIGSMCYIIALLPHRFMRSALCREGGPAWSDDFGQLHTSFFSDPTISALMLRNWQEALARDAGECVGGRHRVDHTGRIAAPGRRGGPPHQPCMAGLLGGSYAGSPSTSRTVLPRT